MSTLPVKCHSVSLRTSIEMCPIPQQFQCACAAYMHSTTCRLNKYAASGRNDMALCKQAYQLTSGTEVNTKRLNVGIDRIIFVRCQLCNTVLSIRCLHLMLFIFVCWDVHHNPTYTIDNLLLMQLHRG